MKKLGIIGVGNMGGAIAEGIVKYNALPPEDIILCDKSPELSEKAEKLGVKAVTSPRQAAEAADILILAVKPKDSLAALKEAGSSLNGKAVISIVAGLSYAAIDANFPERAFRVLVSIPNTPVKIGAGAVGLTVETNFTPDEKEFTQKLFESMGIVEWIPEKSIAAFSAISGSGPAYAALLIEAMGEGGALSGLPISVAQRLAMQTVYGTGKLCLERGVHPAIIRTEVCSPGGTTIEAIAELEKAGFRYGVMNAVHAAFKKFFELVG
ncbi:MAG: pyrroline-5-carboxylate reductase [Deferribacteraceae bacterium]|nr:pyrroline-5-carboxylate reductase [Deferribacteraceae bacterium]